MKFLPLVWAALWHRKPRTVFTMLSIGVAFLLYGLLSAVNAALTRGIEITGSERLITTGRYSLTQLLPQGHGGVIQGLEGVENVTFATWFGGYYQHERNFFPQLPVDAERYLQIYSEIELPPEQRAAFLSTRTGAIVARSLAQRFGWELGDRIPIQAGIWPPREGGNVWTFDLVGIFDVREDSARRQLEVMLFRHEFFDEARQFGRGFVGWFITRVSDPARAATVAAAIDEAFRNSPFETRTDTEKAFNQSLVRQLGDIGLIISSILGAVFFTLLFLTGNTMMQSVRERTPELAVLKTLGFRNAQLLTLVLAEALALCLIAAGIGLALAASMVPLLAANLPGFTGFALRPAAIGMGLALAVALALIVGLPPATRAARLDIVQALGGH